MAYNPEKVSKHFDFEVPLYDSLLKFFPGYNRTIKKLIDETPSGERLLDLGTGTGILAFGLSDRYKEITGVDISPKMIDKCNSLKKKKRIDNCLFDVAEILELKYPAESFDTIISGYVFHHLEDKEKNKLFSDMYNMLKKDGTVIFCDYMKKDLPKKLLDKTLYLANEFGRRVVLVFEGDILNDDESPIKIQDYMNILRDNRFRDIETIDFAYNTDAIIKAKK